jgi:hypothetical protein
MRNLGHFVQKTSTSQGDTDIEIEMTHTGNILEKEYARVEVAA